MDFRCHDSYVIERGHYMLSRSIPMSKWSYTTNTIQSDNPIMDKLNFLLYPDPVLWETLHMSSPTFSTITVAAKGDIMPLGTLLLIRKSVIRYLFSYLYCEDRTWRNDLCYVEHARGRQCLFRLCQLVGWRHYGERYSGIEVCVFCVLIKTDPSWNKCYSRCMGQHTDIPWWIAWVYRIEVLSCRVRFHL